MRGRSKGLERSRRYRVARVMEGRDIADSGGDLLQDLETLVVELGAERENAGDPASGLGEARHQALRDGIAPENENDGYRGRRSFG